MNVVRKGVWVIMIAVVWQCSCAHAPQRGGALFETNGEVSRAKSGWTYQAGSEEEMVYIPFEGVYPNKGGRMQSPWFSLPDTGGRGAYYRLTFKAKTAEHCYWWLDYRDENGESIPDCNSEVYVGDEIREYDEVVYVPGAVREVQIAFVSKGKVEASDIRFTTATAEEAAEWADALYATLPPLKFDAPADAMALLPKTVAAMKNGTPWRVVMLGNSHMNDTFNSLFMALVERDFPESRFNVVASVRGRTGCSYYKLPEPFQQYIVAQKPDLLIILGRRGSEDVEEVVKMTREQVGCEMVIMSNPIGRDWRPTAGGVPWRELKGRRGGMAFDVSPLRECAAKLNVAFWDMTTPGNDYLAVAGEIDFNRDGVHSNDNGKQIIGRILHRYFLTAK